MKSPAHKTFIDRYINWKLVEERLSRYKHTEAAYPLKHLQDCSNKPPYYAHYFAWRLGTWKDESFFKFFDNLLAVGASMDNWGSNKNLLRSHKFDDFWGLIWQLQVAKFFVEKEDTCVAWMKSGPDLKVTIKDKEFYVECYTYRKSFGLEEFVEELLQYIHPSIRVGHIPCSKFSLPKDNAIERFLDELFELYLNPAFLPTKLAEAEIEHPVKLASPKEIENFEVYLEGNNDSKYVAGENAIGHTEIYLNHAIQEALRNKELSNKLESHRPNLLAINYLLDQGFQIAYHRQIDLGKEVQVPNLGTIIDGVLLAACGIGKDLSMGDGVFLDTKKNHPIIDIGKIRS